MKVWGDFLGPPHSTDKTTLMVNVRKIVFNGQILVSVVRFKKMLYDVYDFNCSVLVT